MAVIRYSKETKWFRIPYHIDAPLSPYQRKWSKHYRNRHIRTNAKKFIAIYEKGLSVK